jgi:hypothetical protein
MNIKFTSKVYKRAKNLVEILFRGCPNNFNLKKKPVGWITKCTTGGMRQRVYSSLNYCTEGGFNHFRSSAAFLKSMPCHFLYKKNLFEFTWKYFSLNLKNMSKMSFHFQSRDWYSICWLRKFLGIPWNSWNFFFISFLKCRYRSWKS